MQKAHKDKTTGTQSSYINHQYINQELTNNVQQNFKDILENDKVHLG